MYLWMRISKYTIVSTLCCVFERVWLWRKSLQFILLDCYVTQPPFSTHLFQGSRKAAFSSSLPVSCPPAKSLFVGQFKLSSASLPSLWPYYFHLLNTIRFSLQGEEMKKETEDHVALITKKKVHLSTLCWPRYELQFHCWRGCVPLQW